jgi:hypothetical protein
MLDAELSPDYSLNHIATSLHRAYAKVFLSNSVLRGAPPALALETFNTCVLASANNLLSLFTPNNTLRKAFNDVRNRVARLVMGAGGMGPDASAVSLSRIAELDGIVAREHVRLLYTLQRSPFRKTAMACRVLAVLQKREHKRHTPHALVSWSQTSSALIAETRKSLGINFPVPPTHDAHSSDSKTAAGRYGRAVGLAHFQKAALQKARRNGTLPRPGQAAHAPPRASPPSAHVLDLAFNYSTDPNTLGPHTGRTSLSSTGPGCSGSILSIIAETGLRDAVSFISHLHLGRLSLFTQAAKAPPCVSFPASLRPTNTAFGYNVKRLWHSAAAGSRTSPCPLCHSPGLGPYHVLLECTHRTTRDARRLVRRDLESVVKAIVSAAHLARAMVAVGAHKPADPRDIAAAESEGTLAANALRKTSAEDRRFVHFRLLLVLPWSEDHAPPYLPVSRSLGRTFDSTDVPVRLLRQIASKWTRRSYDASRSIIGEWSRGVQLLWTTAGGTKDEGAAFSQTPFPASLPASFAAFCRRTDCLPGHMSDIDNDDSEETRSP